MDTDLTIPTNKGTTAARNTVLPRCPYLPGTPERLAWLRAFAEEADEAFVAEHMAQQPGAPTPAMPAAATTPAAPSGEPTTGDPVLATIPSTGDPT